LSESTSHLLCSAVYLPFISLSLSTNDLTQNSVELLHDWIRMVEQEVPAAARVEVPSLGVVFNLDALDSQEAGIFLLESMRRLLCEQCTPTFLAWFGDCLPKDMADYLHSSASYTMSVQRKFFHVMVCPY
jgi:hypothetical protein